MIRKSKQIIPLEIIYQKIYLIRGQKVMLDSDLAFFYQVNTKDLNKAVSRNAERFPEDFMFQLNLQEIKKIEALSITKSGKGGRRYLPYAFTEQGVAMLSAVLNSSRAIIVSVEIIRSFVKLREMLLLNETLSRRVRAIEAKTDDHAKAIMQIIQELTKRPEPNKRRIGF